MATAPDQIPVVYAKSLLTCTPGYALWMPSPFTSDPQDVQDNGVEIGDVGIITSQGEFMYFFNICKPNTHPRNAERPLPLGFQYIPEGHVDRREGHFSDGEDVKSDYDGSHTIDAGVQVTIAASLTPGVKAEYTSSAASGALLHFPWGADRANVRNVEPFRQLATDNAVAWYELACKQLGRTDINGDLYLVTGHDKSSVWAIAAHHSLSQQISISLNLHLLQLDRGGCRYSYQWDNRTSAQTRAGPRLLTTEGSKLNQCAVVRGFKIRLGDHLWPFPGGNKPRLVSVHDHRAEPRKVFYSLGRLPASFTKTMGSIFSRQKGTGSSSAQHGEHVSEGSTVGPNSVIVEHVPLDMAESTKSYHPSDVLNRHLLQSHKSADIAITHDLDWFLCLKELHNRDPKVGLPSDMRLSQAMVDSYGIVRSPNSRCVYFDCGHTKTVAMETMGMGTLPIARELVIQDTPQNPVLVLLQSRDNNVRVRAMHMLLDLSKDAAFVDVIGHGISIIVGFFKELDFNLRARATDAIVELSSNVTFTGPLKQAIPSIFAYLKDPLLKDSAIGLLAKLSTNPTFGEEMSGEIPSLVNLLGHPDPRVRGGAINALAQLAGNIWLSDEPSPLPNFPVMEQAIATIQSLLNDGNFTVRGHAANALKELSTKDAFIHTITRLDIPSSLRQYELGSTTTAVGSSSPTNDCST